MKQQPVARVSSVRIDVEERGPAAVRFDLGERAAAATVRLDVLHALGVTTGSVPADAAEVTIDLRALPAGPAELRVTAVDADGREGKPSAISFAVPGRRRHRPRDHRARRPRPRPAPTRQELDGGAAPAHRVPTSRAPRRARSTSS